MIKTDERGESVLFMPADLRYREIPTERQPPYPGHKNCPSGYFVARARPCFVGQITTMLSAILLHEEGRSANRHDA
jgi:hypothetical protein